MQRDQPDGSAGWVESAAAAAAAKAAASDACITDAAAVTFA